MSKETLLKTVAQSVPVYAMSCFILPQSLVHDIDRIMATIGRGIVGLPRKFIERLGRTCVFLRVKGVSTSKILALLMQVC